MKRITALILALAMILCMGACGQSESTAEASSAASAPAAEASAETAEPEAAEPAAEEAEPAAEASAAEEAVEASAAEEEAAPVTTAVALPKPEEPTTLTYMVTINPNNMNLYNTLSDLVVWQEIEKQTNVGIDATCVNAQEGQTQFSLMITSGDYTDLLDSVSSNYTTGVAGALDDDIIIELTDYINDSMPNYATLLYSEDVYLKGATLDDGRMGMIYSLTPVTEDECTSGPVIRQDWLDELGLDTPVTYDDLHDVLVAFRDNYGASMWIPYSGAPMGNYLGAGYGIATAYITMLRGREPFYQVDGTIKFGPTEDAYYDWLEMMSQWYDEGLIWSDFTSATDKFNGPPEDKVLDGTFGVWFGETNNWATWATSATDPDFHCVAFADPVQNEGDVNHLRTYNEPITNGGISISTACADDKIDAAIYLLDYFFSEEGSFLCSFGIEGQAFEYDADGHPQYTDLITANPDGLTESQALVVYAGSSVSIAYDNAEEDFLIDTDTEDQNAASDIWKATSDAAYDIPDLCTISSEDSATYSATMADIGTYISEWTLKIITGQEELTEESFQEYLATVESMDIDTAMSIKQNALDNYNAR